MPSAQLGWPFFHEITECSKPLDFVKNKIFFGAARALAVSASRTMRMETNFMAMGRLYTRPGSGARPAGDRTSRMQSSYSGGNAFSLIWSNLVELSRHFHARKRREVEGCCMCSTWLWFCIRLRSLYQTA